MRLHFLGTGSVHAAPVPGCTCPACVQIPIDRRRQPAMALVEGSAGSFLIDAGIDHLRDVPAVSGIEAIVLTHFHHDHVAGLFPWRWAQGEDLPVFCPPDPEGCADLYRNPGIFRFEHVELAKTFVCAGVAVTPVALQHSAMTFGYLLEQDGCKIAYLTDTNGLSENTKASLLAFEPQYLVLDCTRFKNDSASANHGDFASCLELHGLVPAAELVLTHLSHDMEVALLDGRIADSAATAAYDEMIIG